MSEAAFPLARHAEMGRARLVEGQAGVLLAERRPASICEIAVWPDAGTPTLEALAGRAGLSRLPQPGVFLAGTDATLCGLAPGRFQAVAKRQGLAEWLEPALPATAGALVDLSQARGGVRATGRNAQDVLQKGLDFDLDSACFAVSSVALGTIHHMPVTVLRLDTETFDLFTFRGFAVSLWEWLTGSATEYGWRAAPPVE